MDEAAKRSLKLGYQKRTGKKRESKKWFDLECKKLRASLRRLSNKKHRNPRDMETRAEYIIYKTRNFKTWVNIRSKHFDSKISELINTKNSHTFWSNFKSLNENDSANIEHTPIDRYYNHFKNLHSAEDHSNISSFQSNILNEKLLLEQDKHLYSKLDTPETIKEVEKATKNLKNKKTSGFDRIRNEMSKSSLKFTKKITFKIVYYCFKIWHISFNLGWRSYHSCL